MNLLVTTLGTSWGIIPELLAFTNPSTVPLLQDHPDCEQHELLRKQHSILPVDEVWVASTASTQTAEGIHTLKTWFAVGSCLPKFRLFIPEGVSELGSIEECSRMRELVFRLALHASKHRERTRTAGRLYLSLAGGRKTMSADMQSAAEHFGCDALLHMVDLRTIPNHLRKPTAEQMHATLPASDAACFAPIVVESEKPGRALFDMADPPLSPESFPIDPNPTTGHVPCDPLLSQRLQHLLRDADNLHVNFTQGLLRETEASNFHALYRLSPRQIDRLRCKSILTQDKDASSTKNWLHELPKAELHCHLGGLLSETACLEIAAAHQPEVEDLTMQSPEFARWLQHAKTYRNASVDSVLAAFPDWKSERDRFGKPHRHLLTSAFLVHALGQPDRVRQYLWQHSDPLSASTHSIGIASYERTGDLQGSSLLQSEKAIRIAAQSWIGHCKREHITYCELRCSPHNTVNPALSPMAFVKLLTDALEGCCHCDFRLIIIASRHGALSTIAHHIELVEEWKASNPEHFKRWFAGFDVAGAEYARTPAQLRGMMTPVLEQCLNLTIHAGEGVDSRNIWEAVYELNADRIGHGLSLIQHPDLLRRIRNRRIAIELCPTSNFQIVGFKRHSEPATHALPDYPLKRFLEEGICVTLNTDDPGMSVCSLTDECIRAADMVEGGLTRWQVLQLIRNGYKAAFVDARQRKELLLRAEHSIMQKLGSTAV